MATQSFIQVRVDNQLKQAAIDILDEIGIDMPNAIRMFLKRIVIDQGLPFDTKLPSLSDSVSVSVKPSLSISAEVYFDLLRQVPAGKVTRKIDMEAYLAKIHGVDRVVIESDDYIPHPDVPVWRLLSTRGMLSRQMHYCTRERQHELLEKEGLCIVPCGANSNSLKVENYHDHLFDFNCLSHVAIIL